MQISPIASNRPGTLGVALLRESRNGTLSTNTQAKLALIANRQFQFGLGAAFVGKPVTIAEDNPQGQLHLQSLRNELTGLRLHFLPGSCIDRYVSRVLQLLPSAAAHLAFEPAENSDLLPMGATAAGNQPALAPSPFIPEPDYDLPSEPKCPKPDYDLPSEPECPRPDYKRVSFDKVVTVITSDRATVFDSESEMEK